MHRGKSLGTRLTKEEGVHFWEPLEPLNLTNPDTLHPTNPDTLNPNTRNSQTLSPNTPNQLGGLLQAKGVLRGGYARGVAWTSKPLNPPKGVIKGLGFTVKGLGFTV